jgi:hypothetical protein
LTRILLRIKTEPGFLSHVITLSPCVTTYILSHLIITSYHKYIGRYLTQVFYVGYTSIKSEFCRNFPHFPNFPVLGKMPIFLPFTYIWQTPFFVLEKSFFFFFWSFLGSNQLATPSDTKNVYWYTLITEKITEKIT